jgi:cold shock CspA family protein
VRLDIERGFGFVQELGHREEIYFHWSSLVAGALGQLSVGQLVAFEITTDPRDEMKLRAIRVELLDDKR